MTRLLLSLLFSLFLLGSAPALADDTPDETHIEDSEEDTTPLGPQFYRWTDSEGRVQFSDRPPANQQKNVQQDHLKTAPKVGGGNEANSIYQRTNLILQTTTRPANHSEDTETPAPIAPETNPIIPNGPSSPDS